MWILNNLETKVNRNVQCKSQKLREKMFWNNADENMHHTAQLERFWGNVGNEDEKKKLKLAFTS